VSDQHVVPLDDLREHEACPECWCGPREDSDGVWVHNSSGEFCNWCGKDHSGGPENCEGFDEQQRYGQI